MSTVIRVENISKLYRLGEIGTGSLAHDVNRWWHKVRGKEDPYLKIGQSNDRTSKGDSDYVYALKDVSFEVNQGEVLGIIGRNGAGKSTLLKILSRVTTPTTGEIKAKGRIASLLEVGTGFHPELSGRDNIYLNGAILGMRKHEIASKFDEIVDFSGCDRYIDTPVKRYSSGMYVRLAFAVAAHLEPEILIVDEVLAVGDAEFQKKCLGKMKDVAGQGRTVLFVSHNMAAVKSLCSRAVLLGNGRIAVEGQCDMVVAAHLGEGGDLSMQQEWHDSKSAPGNEEMWLRRIAIEAEPMHPELGITTSSDLKIVTEYWNSNPGTKLNTSLVLYTADDICVFNSWSSFEPRPEGFNRDVCTIPSHLLNDDRYRIRILIVRDGTIPLIDVDHILSFTVREEERDGSWFGKVIGAIRPKLEWKSQHLNPT